MFKEFPRENNKDYDIDKEGNKKNMKCDQSIIYAVV